MADNQKPNIPQGKMLNLDLGESWSERRIITIKYDFKPASIDLSNAILNHGADGSVVIKVPDSNDNDGSMTTVYTGHSYEPKAGILIYNHETDSMVLERINYAYRVKYTRPHNSTVVSEVPNPGDRRKVPQGQEVKEVKRPSSSLSSASKQPLTSASTSRAGGTPSSAQKKISKGGKVMAFQQSEEPPPQVFFLPDNNNSDDEDNVIGNITNSSSDGESSSGDDSSIEEVHSNKTNNSHEVDVPRISPDCSSRSSSKPQNTSTRKPQLSSSGSASDMELAFDDQSSNLYPPASNQSERNNSSRNSASNNNNNNGGHFSSIPKTRFVSNLSDSDSDS